MRNGNNPEIRLSKQKPANRKRIERDRWREQGFKIAQFYVHADDQARVRKFIEKLIARRNAEEE